MIARVRQLLMAAVALLMVAQMGIGLSPVAAQSEAKDQAEATLNLYYSAIDAYDYETAWNQLSKAWQKKQPLDDFIDGFSNTAVVGLRTGDIRLVSGDVVIEVELTAWMNDGTIEGYTGSYTLGKEGGDWRIVSADITTVDYDAPPTRLCKLDDLSFSFGDWDAGAGNRYGYLIATGTSEDRCVLGGVPRISVVIPGAKSPIAVSTGEAGAPPQVSLMGKGVEVVAPIRLANWCVEDGESLLIYVEVPGDTWKAEAGDESDLSIPPCLGDPEDPLFTAQGFQDPFDVTDN